MEIRSWPRPRTPELLAALDAAGATYGGAGYTGLLCPATAVLDAAGRQGLDAGADAIWQWMRTCQELYARLRAGDPAHPAVAALEWGLPAGALAAQRDPAVLARAPLVGRLDAVTVRPALQVAEVQWKGGGEAFLAGVEQVQRQVGPELAGVRPVSSMVDRWVEFFRSRGVGLVVSVGREAWRTSTRLLADALAAAGTRLLLVPAEALRDELRVRGRDVEVRDADRWHRVDFLWADRLPEALPPQLLARVVELALADRLVLDPPPSYLHVHKVCLALPFLPELAAHFPAGTRAVLIPAALLTRALPADPAPVAAALDGLAAEQVGALRDWDELIELPRSAREQLVLKCASADPALSSRGRGVLQLGGSRSAAARSWAFVRDRVSGHGEPWIVQPYVSQRHVAPLAHPDDPGTLQHRSVHARVAAFCVGSPSAGAGVLGAIGNVGPFWKVAGKDAGRDGRGQLTGTAFLDLRAAEQAGPPDGGPSAATGPASSVKTTGVRDVADLSDPS